MEIKDVLTIKEASQVYNLKIDRIRVFLYRGANGLIEDIDYRKSGGTWLITRSAIEKSFKSLEK